MRTEQIYNFIKKYLLETGFTPTYQEICEGVGLKSKSDIHKYMNKLEDAGLIERKGKAYRIVKGYWSIEE